MRMPLSSRVTQSDTLVIVYLFIHGRQGAYPICFRVLDQQVSAKATDPTHKDGRGHSGPGTQNLANRVFVLIVSGGASLAR